MKSELVTACYQLVAAAVNGIYQGIIIVVLVAVSLRMLRRTNAATRCAVWFGTLLVLGVIVPAHYLRSHWDAGAHPETAETAGVDPTSQPYSSEMRLEAVPLPQEPGGDPASFSGDVDFPGSGPGSSADDNISQQYSGSAIGIDSQSPEEPASAISLAPPDSAAVGPTARSTGEAGFPAGIKQRLRRLAERMVTPLPAWQIAPQTSLFVAAIFPIIWLAIAGAKVSFLIGQLFRIRTLKLNSVEPGPQLSVLFVSLRESLGVRRNVAVRVSAECRSALVLGFLKPVILLPAETGCEASEHVLRHELAHVRRHDDWANLVQHFVKAVLFFHPAIWWVSKRVSLEREIACDDQVLQSPMRPKAYALLLANLAGRMQATVLAPGVSTNQSQLKQRIDMILNLNRNTSPRLAKARLGLLAIATILLAVVVINSAPRLAFAQAAEATAPAVAQPEGPDPTTVSSAPTAEIAVSGDAAPSAAAVPSPAVPGEPSVSAGPKFKPGVAVDARPVTAPRPVMAVPATPAVNPAPVAPVAGVPVPVAPMVASAAPVPELDQPVPPGPAGRPAKDSSLEERLDRLGIPQLAKPVPPRPARRPAKDSSLEERLDRLEKMVESLVAQQKGRHFEFAPNPPGEMKFNWKTPSEFEWQQKHADMAKKQAEFDLKMADTEKRLYELDKQWALKDPRAPEKAKELAEQHAKRAEEQAKVAREGQRAGRDAQRRTNQKMREGSQQELEALRRQHEALDKQIEKLDRQIKKLEREQDQLDEQQQNDEPKQGPREKQSNSNIDQPGGVLSNHGSGFSAQLAR